MASGARPRRRIPVRRLRTAAAAGTVRRPPPSKAGSCSKCAVSWPVRVWRTSPATLRARPAYGSSAYDIHRDEAPERVRFLRRQIYRTFQRVRQQRRLDLHRRDLRGVRARRRFGALAARSRSSSTLRAHLQPPGSASCLQAASPTAPSHRTAPALGVRERFLRDVLVDLQPRRGARGVRIGGDADRGVEPKLVAAIQRDRGVARVVQLIRTVGYTQPFLGIRRLPLAPARIRLPSSVERFA